MLEDVIHIVYPSGELEILMSLFFPADLPRVRKLRKLTAEAVNKNPIELLERMRDHCLRRAEELTAKRPEYGLTAETYRVKTLEAIEAVSQQRARCDALKRRKAPKELQKQEREKLAYLREMQQSCASVWRDEQKRYNSAERIAARLRKNAEVLDP